VYYVLAASVVELIAAGQNCEQRVNFRNEQKAQGGEELAEREA
jgi:hypothetical protein